MAAPRPPVTPPADLTMTAVLAHPHASYAAVAALLDGTPIAKRVVNGLAKLEALGGPELLGAIDLEAPMFLATAGERNIVVSVAILPGSEASVRSRLHLDPETDTGSGGMPFTFALVKTPAGTSRLLASVDEAGMKHLGPLVTEMAADAGAPDLHLEVRAAGVRDAAIAGARGSHGKHGEGAGSAYEQGQEVGEKLVEEVLHDVDVFAVDVSLKGGATAALGLRFQSATSPFTRWVTGHPGRVGAPPAAFWHLPESTSVAAFSQGSDPKDLEPLRAELFPALGDAIRDDACPEELKYVLDRIEALLLTGGPYVVAIGGDEAAAASAVEASQKLAHYEGAARARTRLAIEPWFLAELEEPATRWTSALRELAGADAKFASCKKPKPAEGKAAKPVTEHSTMSLAAIPASAHLPKESLHLVNKSVPVKKDGPPASTSHIFVVPEAEHTWIAVGEDETALLARVHDALLGAPESRTLAVREGLELLRAAPVAGGGFGTIEGIQFLGLSAGTSEELAAASVAIEGWRALPSRGTTPIVATWTATSQEARMTVALSRAALTDLVTLASPASP
jgi:hypothetical protein